MLSPLWPLVALPPQAPHISFLLPTPHSSPLTRPPLTLPKVRILCNGLLETIGRVTLEGKLHSSFTAHPKVDPVTGKLHYYR